MAARYLTQADLETVAGALRVQQMFDDDNSGTLDAGELTNLDLALQQAEAHVDSFMLQAYSDTATITILANNDAAFKFHASWIAMEFAAERRHDFMSSDGTGPYAAQFLRAENFFKKLSKGRQRSKGESETGVGANVGGSLKPTMPTDTSRFTFAPDDDNPTGHGGF